MKSSAVDVPVTSELLFSVYVTGFFFPSLLPSLYVFVVNSVGFEIQMSSHRMEEICIRYGWTKLHYCGVSLNLCVFWRLWYCDCGQKRKYKENLMGTERLCSAKSAVICNDKSKQASSFSDQDTDTWSLLEAELRHSILMLNSQKIKIVYRWHWKKGFEEILKFLNL